MVEEIHNPDICNPSSASAEGMTEIRRQETLLKTGALQNAILNSANFSSIATDEMGVIQIFNIGAERMLGYRAADVLNKVTPADISDPREVIARARALSAELGTTITPGFEALVFKASRGIEDIYELTYIRKDGTRLPAIVSVTALHDARGFIIGYLLIGTDNTARKLIEAERQQLLDVQEQTNRLLQQTNLTLQVSEERLAVTLNSIGDAVITTDAESRVTLLNPLAEKLTGWTKAEALGRPVDEVFHIINQETRLPSPHPGQGNPGARHHTGPGQPHHRDSTQWQRMCHCRQLRTDTRPRRPCDRRRAGVPRRHRGIYRAANVARQCRNGTDGTQHRSGRHHHFHCQQRQNRNLKSGRRKNVRLLH